MIRWGQRHPIISGAGILGFVALGLFALGVFLKSPFRDTNPAFVLLNPPQNQFEVYNKENEKVASIPSRWISHWVFREHQSGMSFSRVTDLDHDGRNEIITAVTFDEDVAGGRRPIRVFGSDMVLRHKYFFGRPIRFGSTDYHGDFLPEYLVVDNFSGRGNSDILIGGPNGRSPNLVVRLDADCNLKGEYWHFGNLHVFKEITLTNGQQKVLVLAGSNDVDDARGESLPVIVVLDPSRIAGQTESVGTPGFGLTPSPAEIYYINIPRDGIARALHTKAGAFLMNPEPNNEGERLVFDNILDTNLPDARFEYVFTKEF
jgi:hypothetical protein